MNILNNGRFGLGAGTAGAIKRMLPLITDYTNNRKQFGLSLGVGATFV